MTVTNERLFLETTGTNSLGFSVDYVKDAHLVADLTFNIDGSTTVTTFYYSHYANDNKHNKENMREIKEKFNKLRIYLNKFLLTLETSILDQAGGEKETIDV